MLLTFSEFLTEKFFTGFETRYGKYAEVFKNPTLSELDNVLHVEHHFSVDKKLVKLYGQTVRSFAAIMTTRNFYVFNREISEHSEVAHEIPKLEQDWLPLFCIYFPETRTLGISLSDWSTAGRFKKSPKTDDAVKEAKRHPACRIFKQIVNGDHF